MFATAPTPPHLLQRPTATPPSYLSCAFELPKKAYVGTLACQRDPLLSTLVTEVVRCSKKAKVVAAPVKAKKGKAAAPPAEEGPDEWEVELLDTVLFPEGGGQPSDTGRITPLGADGASDASAASIVREVLRVQLDAVHFVSKPLEVGTKVLVEVDMARRNDLMCQHTGQHLLSAIIDRDLKLDTLSWSLSKAPEPCYIELARAPTPEEIASLQASCNELIAEGRDVRVKMELAGQDGVELGEKVPTNYSDDSGRKAVMRTVEIVDLDINPCCGTHFPSLSRLQSLFISPYTTPIRGTNARIYFVVGPRVLSYLSSSHSLVRASTTELACATSDLPERVAGLKLTATDLAKKEKRLREELATFVAASLWDTATHSTSADGVISGLSFRQEDATNSLEFLSLLASELKTKVDAAETIPRHLFVLASGATSGSAPAGGAVLIVGSDELVVKAGKAVAAKFGARVRGGGKGRWQGKLSGAGWEKGDELLLREVLEAGVAQE